jgi:hypothetical protein
MTLPKSDAAIAELDTTTLIGIYSAGPKRLLLSIEGLSPEELASRIRPGKWSIKETVLHVADAEIMGAARVRQLLAEPGRSFTTCNESDWVAVLEYQTADMARVRSALELFSALRKTTLPLLRMASPDQWKRSAPHPEYGALALHEVVAMYADHGERHIEGILESRRLLGRAIDLPVLLPVRLF